MKIHIEYEVGDKVLYEMNGSYLVGTITYKSRGHFIYGYYVIDGYLLKNWKQIKPYKKEIKIVETETNQ